MKSFHLILNEIEGLLRVLSRGVCVLVTQSCPTLCNPKNCSPPGSSVHGILQARMLEWVAIPFSKQRGNMLQTEPLMLLADCGPFSPKQGKNKWSLGASCEGGEAPHSPGQGPAGQWKLSDPSSGMQCGWSFLRNLLGEFTESPEGHTKGSRFTPNTLTFQEHALWP